MSKDSTMVLILFLVCFVGLLVTTYYGIKPDLGVVTWVLFGFWMGTFKE